MIKTLGLRRIWIIGLFGYTILCVNLSYIVGIRRPNIIILCVFIEPLNIIYNASAKTAIPWVPKIIWLITPDDQNILS